mmetsp:Transcript_5709/g.11389  ORF Transcript_5709/g.11389 Transcript_5709/m.11389 type:complete len:248 (+) Transcript_5709:318-1061(+)
MWTCMRRRICCPEVLASTGQTRRPRTKNGQAGRSGGNNRRKTKRSHGGPLGSQPQPPRLSRVPQPLLVLSGGGPPRRMTTQVAAPLVGVPAAATMASAVSWASAPTATARKWQPLGRRRCRWTRKSSRHRKMGRAARSAGRPSRRGLQPCAAEVLRACTTTSTGNASATGSAPARQNLPRQLAQSAAAQFRSMWSASLRFSKARRRRSSQKRNWAVSATSSIGPRPRSRATRTVTGECGRIRSRWRR